MFVRTLIALAMMALLSAPAAAAGESRDVWHAAVVPPRPGLPAVAIDLGYPGPYLSPVTSPITLHAVAGDLPFDGYIGFHFAVSGARTFNVPVVSRAVLRPHQTWSFTTQADLNYFGALKREVVIEWRTRSLEEVAIGSAGVPPWSVRARRLRVVPPGTDLSASPIGENEWIAHADALPDLARWYSGFRAVLIPLAVWLDLSLRVREAIFASGVHVVFSGLPAPSQRMDKVDKALLPVVFEPQPGSYEIPWPYRTANAGPASVPISWRVKAGTSWTGSSEMPYIASNQVATWVADDAAVNDALPAMALVPLSNHGWQMPRRRIPAVSTVMQSFFPAIAAVLTALVSIGIWIAMRKSPRRVLVIAAIALSAVILFGRESIRPAGHGFDPGDRRFDSPGRTTTPVAFTYEIHTPLAPGVVEHFSHELIYGASPIPAKNASTEIQRTSITHGGPSDYHLEIRDSTTAPGWGVMTRNQDWDAVWRSSKRRELGESPRVHVLRRDATNLVVNYESAMPVDRIAAEWVYGGQAYYGEAKAHGRKNGTVTIDNGVIIWRTSSSAAGSDVELPAVFQGEHPLYFTKVSLFQRTRSRMEMAQWVDPFPGPDRKSASFFIVGRLEKDSNGALSRLFALPVTLIKPGATALISVPRNLAVSRNDDKREVIVSCAGSSTKAIRTGRNGATFESVAYAVPPEMLHQIIQQGGMLRVTLNPQPDSSGRVKGLRDATYYETAWVEVWEKKP